MTQPEATRTVNLVPDWKAAAHMIAMLLENSDEAGKAKARAELQRMAGLLDDLLAERKADQ